MNEKKTQHININRILTTYKNSMTIHFFQIINKNNKPNTFI